MINKNSKIYIAGHNGMVGSAILRKLKDCGYKNLIFRKRDELDLLNQKSVHSFLVDNKPDYIFIAAAKVGGIHANNTYRADFIFENLTIASNIIGGAHIANLNRLCFLGSSCIYPKYCSQPMKEKHLLTGKLEETNEPYAISKIAGIKLCENFNAQYNRSYISLMPTNLYGPNDNYHPENSHVLPALIRRFHEAKVNKSKEMYIWGDGSPKREFLHVNDLADACVFLMEKGYKGPLINIGSNVEVSIKELATLIQKIIGFTGSLKFDISKPNGMPRKLMDSSSINKLGWKPRISLEQGIKSTYKEYLSSI